MYYRYMKYAEKDGRIVPRLDNKNFMTLYGAIYTVGYKAGKKDRVAKPPMPPIQAPRSDAMFVDTMIFIAGFAFSTILWILIK